MHIRYTRYPNVLNPVSTLSDGGLRVDFQSSDFNFSTLDMHATGSSKVSFKVPYSHVLDHTSTLTDGGIID